MRFRTRGTRQTFAGLAGTLLLTCVWSGAGFSRAHAFQDTDPPDDIPGSVTADDPAPGKGIRFAFDGATLNQIIDFFSRETGLPVVRETDVPDVVVRSYHAPEAYEMSEALRVLNTILQTHDIMLRVDGEKLYLQKLDDMIREKLPIFQGKLPEYVTDDQIVIAVVPLQNALAKPLAEKLAEMVAAYGSVTSMDAQNSLIIAETAGKIRQLMTMIDVLDLEDPQGLIEIFKIRHMKASEIMEPLKALMAEKVQKYVINPQNNKQTLIEEEEIRGLTITHHDHSNSIVAKGIQSKIDQLREAITLLDVPAAGSQRMIRTFVLMVLSPSQALEKLNLLYNKLPEAERPTLMPFDDTGKITIIGPEAAINEGALLLEEIDGASDGSPVDERTVSVFPLSHADARAVAATVQQLLNGRQAAVTKLVPGQDGRSLIVSGLTRDVKMIEALLPILDQPQQGTREVRMIRIASDDAADVIKRARDLYDKQTRDGDASLDLELDFDEGTRTATVLGAKQALDLFAESLRLVQDNQVIERERRQFALVHAAPSEVARGLQTLAKQLLADPEREYIEPEFSPVDQLDLLLVTAAPDQFAVLSTLIETLDRDTPEDFQFRIVSLVGISRPDDLLQRAEMVYGRLTRGYTEDEMEHPEKEIDALTGNLLLTGQREAIALYERAIAEARQLLPPARDGRLIELQFARAADVVGPLRELIETTTTTGPREVPDPEIKVVERTNSLYIIAEEAQHAMIARFVSELDTIEPKDLPPLRLIQVRAADAVQLATLLRARYDSRPQEQRREQPVTLDADAATNTLIVTAPPELYDDINAFVESVNKSKLDAAERVTRLFPLKQARAADLAAALEKLYPEPPMPLDARRRPMPHLRKPKEVFVSADANTNTLMIEAPAERMASFETLVEQLDRVELPPQAELRTFRIERGDIRDIVKTLTNLKDQLTRQPEDGSKPVPVYIEAEPQSRTLIVAGDEFTFTKVEAVLRDLQAVPIERELRVIEVLRADPQDLADRAKSTYLEMTKDDLDATEIEVEVDPENATLLVVAEAQAMVRFVAIVNQLQDSIGPPADVRLLALEYARPSDVVEFLEELATNEIVRLGQGAGAKATYFAMDRLNAILVSARPEQHPVIESIAKSLDQQESQQMPPLRILQLRTADAQNFASALMTQYNQRPADEKRLKPVTITADPNTNALVVAAHPDLLPEIQAIVADLNDINRMDSEGREIRIFPLKVARAEELARVMDEMYPEPKPLLDRRGRPIPGSQPEREVVVRADPQTNSLIVDASIQRMAGFVKLVEQLDRQKIDEDTEIRTYPVVYADLDALTRSLTELRNSGSLGVADRTKTITITTEPVSRTLIVSGPTDVFPQIEDVLKSLDVRPAGPTTSLRFFPLQNVRADTIAPMLREILVARIVEEVPQAGSSGQSLLNVSTDRKTNTLIISAPDAVMPVAEELIRQLDSDSVTSLGDPVVRVRPLTFASAADVTTSLSAALPELVSKATGDPVDVRLIPSSGSNAIILVGLESDLPQVEELIEGLDSQQQSTEAMDAATFRLEFADAVTVAPILQRLLSNQLKTDPRFVAQQLRSRRGQVDLTPEIQVEADARTNSLIVSGTVQTVELARTLVTQLDQPDDASERIVTTYTPQNADADALITTVKRVVDSTRAGSRRSTLELIDEPSSGAIVVIGSREETDRATALLEEWDQQAPTPPQIDLKIVRLENSDAQVVALALTPMLRDQASWPENLRRLIDLGIPVSQPTVTADPQQNRLLISAPKELLAAASRLVAELDTARGDEDAVDVRIFNLTTAQADDVAASLQDALAKRADARPGEPAPSITAETSSNSVIVSGTPGQLQQIETMIESIDAGLGPVQVQVRTIFLDHARAEAVAPTIETLLAAEEPFDLANMPNWLRRQIIQEQMQQGEQPPAIRVAADQRLNAVVISAPVAVLEVAEQLVRQLDVDSAIGLDGARAVRVLTIENSDAAELAANLEEIFADEDESGESAPTIRVNARSNSLIIRATAKQFETIELVVGEVDRAALGTMQQFSPIAIDPARASAREVAETIERLFRRRGGSTVEVMTIDDLLKRGRKDQSSTSDTEQVDDGRPLSLAPPGGASPFGLVAAGLFAAVQDEDAKSDLERRLDNVADITIAVDDETNSLIVLGSPRAVERVRALAEQIQAGLPAMPGTIRYLTLPESIDAGAVAGLVNETLQQITPPGGERGGLRQRVMVMPDPGNNALIIAANDVDFETVADLLVAVTQPASAERVVVKVYPLRTITADRAAQSVRDLIGDEATQRPGRGRGRGRQTERMRRTLEIQFRAQNITIDAVFDPSRIRVSGNEQSNSLIVMGPEEAIRFIDQFVELIDQSSFHAQASLKLYPLKHAQATDLREPVRQVLSTRWNSLPREQKRATLQPEVAADGRTNTLMVTASPEQLAELDGILDQLDVDLEPTQFALRMIEVKYRDPTEAATILEEVVIGNDQELRKTTSIIAVDAAGLLLVRAPAGINQEIDDVLSAIDRDLESEFPVRTLTLQRANAQSVAETLQNLYDQRGAMGGRSQGDRRSRQQRIAIVGDEVSRMLVIAASDEDFEEIKQLVEQFDSQESIGLDFAVYQLKHAKAQDIADQVQNLVNSLMWNQQPTIFFDPFFFGRGGGGRRPSGPTQGTLAVAADQRLNALIVTGEGDKFDMVEKIIDTLDAPLDPGAERIVKVYPLHHAQVDVVSDVIHESLAISLDDPRRQWMRRDPNELSIRTDEKSKTLIIAGTASEHERIASLIAQLDEAARLPEQTTAVLAVEFGAADEMARTLEAFLRERAEARNLPASTAVIVPSATANNIVVSASADDLATIRDLLSQIDRQHSDNQVLKIIALKKADAEDVARIIGTHFKTRGGEAVRVTPDLRSNSLIISAPSEVFATAQEIIATLDAPPPSDEMIIRTYALDSAQAADMMTLLTETLDLDVKGETTGVAVTLEELGGDPVIVEAKITSDRRSNSLIIRATPESFPVVESLINQFDNVETKSPVEWRIITLQHALVYDVFWPLRDFLRDLDQEGPQPNIDYYEPENQFFISATPDQFKQIDAFIEQIDIEREKPITEFITLKHAPAEVARDALGYFYGTFAPGADTPAKLNTRIVANPATNSLLVSSEAGEWERIRALLAEIDIEEFDPSLQLKVIALTYADAESVARAINDAFQAQVQGRGNEPRTDRQQPRPGGGDNEDGRRDQQVITQLVEVEDWVRASAEPLTNSVVVSANRQNLAKIETIVREIDSLEFAQGPPPRLIPITSGSAEQFAESLRAVYESAAGQRRGGGPNRRRLRIVPNEASSTIIVRAEEEEFLQIRALAEALQSESEIKGLSVHILQLRSAPAVRVEEAIRDAFAAKAEQTNQPLSVTSDPMGNSLIVACTAALFAEIKETVDQLDALQPPAGQGIFIIELENIDPEKAKSIIETIGLDKPQDPDSVSRLVTEPIKVSTLPGRNAIIVIANPADRDTVIGILKAIDAQPEFGETTMRVIHLANAEASAIANVIAEMLKPADQQSSNPLARAVEEQVRRLSLRRNGADEPDLTLDLTKPIRVIVNDVSNSLIIGSTEQNLAALAEVIESLDTLPITDAVVVQLYPLENIEAEDFQRIVEDLFNQGRTLGRAPGSEIEGVPASTVGRALAGALAMSVDQRTNTIVVAGSEEAVAFVEVMKIRLDSQSEIGWVEPRIIKLEYANAGDLAETIQAILVDGTENLPQSTPLQKQIGRIRSALGQHATSDVFVPMTRLVVRAEDQLNALIVVGTKSNLEVIEELVAMFDVKELAPEALIRIYPIEHASAGRLAGTIGRLFDQQLSQELIREEDAVIIEADERTNALVVSTSKSSFDVVESLIERLDSEVAPEFAEIRRLEIEHASATRLADMIQTLMDARFDRLQKIEPESADLEKASIVADPRTNSLIVAASNDSYQVIRRLVDELDSATALTAGEVQILKLDHGNAERMADVANQIMDRRYQEMPAEIRAAQQPLILTDPRSNSLLIAANPEDYTAIERLVTRLEATQLDPLVQIEVVPLKTKQAEQFAPTVERLMEERLAGLGDARTDADRVSIEPEPVSNSLIVSTTPEHMETIRGLVRMLEEAEPSTNPIEVINLSRYKADDIVTMIEEMYVAGENNKRGPDTIRLSADDRLNSLVVNAPTSDIERIRDLVVRLEERGPVVQEIQTIPLIAADPLEIVGLLNEVLRGPGLDGRRNPNQAVIFRLVAEAAEEDGIVREQESDEVEISTAIRESISLVPDRRTNSVIVTAPKESMQLIKTLIEKWDQSTEGNLNLRVFHLENADAEGTAQILADLFSTPEREVLVPVGDQDLNELAPGIDLQGPPDFGLTELTTIPDPRKQLSITVDSRTNSLIVAGTPRYLDLVEEVVLELDSDMGTEREQFVYPLKNAVADDVAQVIGDFIDEDQRKLIETLPVDQRGSATRLLEREVTIVGDSKSNSVIVSVSPRYRDRVMEMIDQLDVDPPQVLIQVLLAEITLDSGDDWGVDFNVTRREGDVNVSAGFGLASTFLSGMGVPNISIVGTDFDLLIRALQTQGRLQVLSNPSIMAANNETALIQVGETIRVPAAQQVSDAGIQSQVTAVELGVVLNVTPTINPEGFVRMVISPSISSLSQRTTQISETFESPIITVRRADTTVTVMDGQTIVIGGLISDRFEVREEAVPFLSDLPILGALFRSKSEQQTKTELLIVLTPHVITSPAALPPIEPNTVRSITEAEINRLSIPEEIKEQIRRGMIEGSGILGDDPDGRSESGKKDDESKKKKPITYY